MKISIVISVYNLENYIAQCLESLVTQIFDNFEIILVNDGSTDRSEAICKSFLSDDKVKYFYKSNGGASSARNFGLQKATGDYVIFMDGDDFWDNSNALQLLAEKGNDNPDIIIFGCKDLDEKTGSLTVSRNAYNIDSLENAQKDKLIEDLTSENRLPGAAWLVCSKKDFLLKNHIVFKEGVKAEDIDWVYSVFYYGETFRFLNEPFYIYRKNRKNSATFSFDDKSISGILFTVQKWTQIIAENPDLKYLLFNLNFHFLLTVIFAKSFSDKQLSLMNNHQDLLNYPLTFRNKVLSQFIKIFGIKTSNKMFSYVNSYR